MRRSLLILVAGAMVFSACGVESNDAGASSTTSTSIPSSSTTTTEAQMTPEDTVPARDPLVQASIDGLIAAKGFSEAGIDVDLFETVTWRDGSLGCPDPEKSYTQSLVEGYRVVLTHGGEEFHFHGAAGGQPFLCENPTDPAPGGGNT